MSRGFTFIDDVIEIIIKLINKPSTTNKSFDSNPETILAGAQIEFSILGMKSQLNY